MTRPGTPMDTHGSEGFRARLLRLVDRPEVLQRLDAPVRLASGELSQVFIDAKVAVASASDLALVGSAMSAAARDRGIEVDAVGGLVLGAAPFTFGVAQAAGCSWFLIRKEPKGRGTNQWVEGAKLTPGLRVMLVDDVVTTGGSIETAYERAVSSGARVVFATTLVDRGDLAAAFFEGEGVPYVPMLTYRDLAIEPVGRGGHEESAVGSVR